MLPQYMLNSEKMKLWCGALDVMKFLALVSVEYQFGLGVGAPRAHYCAGSARQSGQP
jgi:hypothetical protein